MCISLGTEPTWVNEHGMIHGRRRGLHIDDVRNDEGLTRRDGSASRAI